MLYRRCANEHGWLPLDVDRLEVWEAGAALGVATYELEQYQSGADRPGAATPVVQSAGRDYTAERVLASKGLGPPVEAPVMAGGSIMALQEALRGG